jgi:hypothetical protein
MQTTEMDLADKEEVSLPLECHKVPNKKEQLCLGRSASRISPVPADDIVLYHRDGDGYLTFIHSNKGYVGSLYFDSFSTNGKFIIMAVAEEGHPSFSVHETQKYFAGDTESIAFIAKYEYTSIESLDDDGNIVIDVMEHHKEDGVKCVPIELLYQGKPYIEDICTIKYNIYDRPDVY